MRVIKIELPASPRALDDTVSLSSSDVRHQLYQELAAIEAEVSELVKQKGRSYFPENYSVFTRSHFDETRNSVTTELWVVDPTIRWPAGLLARSAWKLFIPIMVHVVEDAYSQRLVGATLGVRERDASITVFAPTRGWRDPIILSGTIVLISAVFWLLAWPYLQTYLSSLSAGP
ncbi:MAG: hypothetical protein ACR2PG_18460 [Hyphomicrobiaceae bacterium]